jgi:YaiO family outer membrane protein
MGTSISSEPETAADARVNRPRSAFLGLCLTLLFAAPAGAQTFTVELVGGRQALSAGYGDGGMIGVRTRYEAPANVWYAAVTREARFNDTGYSASLANTHVINPDWYSYLSVAGSTETFFLPRYRVDGQIARKFGAERQWVATAAVGMSAAHDEHRDAGAGIGLIRYFEQGVIIEGSVFWNRSNPGGIIGRRQHLAVTWVRPQRFQVTVRAGAAREAYQLTAVETVLVDFNSTEAALAWQQWLTPSSGVSVAFDYYQNPAYHRSGITASVFKRFGP